MVETDKALKIMSFEDYFGENSQIFAEISQYCITDITERCIYRQARRLLRYVRALSLLVL